MQLCPLAEDKNLAIKGCCIPLAQNSEKKMTYNRLTSYRMLCESNLLSLPPFPKQREDTRISYHTVTLLPLLAKLFTRDQLCCGAAPGCHSTSAAPSCGLQTHHKMTIFPLLIPPRGVSLNLLTSKALQHI